MTGLLFPGCPALNTASANGHSTLPLFMIKKGALNKMLPRNRVADTNAVVYPRDVFFPDDIASRRTGGFACLTMSTPHLSPKLLLWRRMNVRTQFLRFLKSASV